MRCNKNCNKRRTTQGGGVAAPVGGQIFSEILQYLEVKQENQNEIEIKEEVEVPNIMGLSIKEAEKILSEKSLKVSIEGITDENKGILDKENNIVKEQTPKAGVKIKQGSNVYVDFKESNT